MVNMGYCRVENTYAALKELMFAWDDAGSEWYDKLSEEEQRYALKLLRLCARLVEFYGDGEE